MSLEFVDGRRYRVKGTGFIGTARSRGGPLGSRGEKFFLVPNQGIEHAIWAEADQLEVVWDS